MQQTYRCFPSSMTLSTFEKLAYSSANHRPVLYHQLKTDQPCQLTWINIVKALTNQHSYLTVSAEN
ncbi:hypothetical protein Hamer_G023935 [Homarus americanus]|uniref:Uncharacterized protein n=1 Tax=Homarus americanus TaxID=6706 RepID=A0A8J5N5L4_HOMAM|nr:hypothetical protein Hamer_G023935 [Homarus americanus]